jgi:hypothetical protein
MFLEKKYHLETDQYGLALITITGRCTEDERDGIEEDCTRRYKMETMPNAAGAILKSLDGTNPQVVTITPSTWATVISWGAAGPAYQCVKVDGRCNPHAYQQAAGPFAGHTILTFLLKYQEVGGVA